MNAFPGLTHLATKSLTNNYYAAAMLFAALDDEDSDNALDESNNSTDSDNSEDTRPRLEWSTQMHQLPATSQKPSEQAPVAGAAQAVAASLESPAPSTSRVGWPHWNVPSMSVLLKVMMSSGPHLARSPTEVSESWRRVTEIFNQHRRARGLPEYTTGALKKWLKRMVDCRKQRKRALSIKRDDGELAVKVVDQLDRLIATEAVERRRTPTAEARELQRAPVTRSIDEDSTESSSGSIERITRWRTSVLPAYAPHPDSDAESDSDQGRGRGRKRKRGPTIADAIDAMVEFTQKRHEADLKIRQEIHALSMKQSEASMRLLEANKRNWETLMTRIHTLESTIANQHAQMADLLAVMQTLISRSFTPSSVPRRTPFAPIQSSLPNAIPPFHQASKRHNDTSPVLAAATAAVNGATQNRQISPARNGAR